MTDDETSGLSAGVFRDPPQERCARCTETAAARCPRCNRFLCGQHAVPPEHLCGDCAAYELMRSTHSGRRPMKVAMIAVTGIWIVILGLYTLMGGRPFPSHRSLIGEPVLFPLLQGLVIASLLSLLAVLGGFVARAQARSRVKRERGLPTTEREAIERAFRERHMPSASGVAS